MTKLPTLQGVIRRRILINWRFDPAVIQRVLPAPFRPKLHDGNAIAGVCLIRLEQIRPRFVPAALGLASENAAHRIAVAWTDEAGVAREGVYIARRDSGSRLNHWLGGRVFPGEHHRARFDVRDDGQAIELAMRSDDGAVSLAISGHAEAALPAGSCFRSLAEASAFFQTGALGYSETAAGDHLDGLHLVTPDWSVGALAVTHAHTTFFENRARFPRGSGALDCALIMRDLAHEWRAAPDLPRAATTVRS